MPDDALLVELLGPVRAWLGTTELRLGPTRQRALFAVLAVRHNHVVARTELIRAVWGDQAPHTAEGSVYTYLSGLRRVLEPGRSSRAASALLPSESAGYRLRLAPESLDAVVFERLSGQARAALAGGDPLAAAELADQGLARWHGEPLTGLPGPFAATHRQRLTDLRLAMLATRAEAGLATGRHAELVAELTTLVARNPLHEGLRGLLMIALYRCGRQADALDQFREARLALDQEVGGRPDARLAEIHQQILANDPALAQPEPPSESGRPTGRQRALRPRRRASAFVGRDTEAARLRAALTALGDGRGGLVWVDGEPGIGKSELLTTGLAGLDTADVQVAWATGDEQARRFPLRVLHQSLGVRADATDPRRSRLAELAGGTSTRDDLLGTGGNPLAVADATAALVRDLCADGPLVLVVDDMQWVDETSMHVWDLLARQTDRLPLLLVAACRPLPTTPALDLMRDTVVRAGGTLLALSPLSEPDVDRLLRELINAIPGPGLAGLAAQAAGNPLYIEELVESLVRDRAVRVAAGRADAGRGAAISLGSALAHRLGFLSPDAIDVLRRASLLGTEFRIDELSTVLVRPPADVLAAVDEATTAGVLVANGDRMAFRHQLIRQALYEGMAPALRTALHRQAAERLDRAAASVEIIAGHLANHLAAASTTVDSWTIGWVHDHGEQVAARAPDIGRELLRRAVPAGDPADPRRTPLTASLARVRYWLGESPEEEVRAVLAATTDPDLTGEMHWILACVHYRRGLDSQAVELLRAAVDTSGVSDIWRARCLALLAARERALGDPAVAEATAWRAIDEADRVGDAFAKAYALENLWLFRSISRDHGEALQLVDRALSTVDQAPAGVGATLVHLRLSLLDNRVFSLQNLDRLAEADETLRAADEVMRHRQLPTDQWVSPAINHYWAGRWDEAIARLSVAARTRELDLAFHGLRESGPMMLLLYGVSALIAVCRGDQALAGAHLAAADDLPMFTTADRESCDFLLAAEALVAEQDGRPEVALIALRPIIDERYSPMMLRHQWLPDVVRIAMAVGDTETARRALGMCAAEAERETVPARAAAAFTRCRGLLNEVPADLLAAAGHYERVARPVELAKTLEDAAVVLARTGQHAAAREAYATAVGHYRELGASWLIRRADARLTAAGVTAPSTHRAG
ncbi:BTAD domain-containing putative transcriptional regulator [Actinophytocola sediminis]